MRTSADLQTGQLILNADDWGRDQETTDKTLDCAKLGALSSVSAMVFMEDSERAAELALEHGVDAGLHLNLTAAFSGAKVPADLRDQQQSIRKYLSRNSLSRGIFNPLLARSFEYVVNRQREEFARLYGREPQRLDGHHHMHLSANVLLGGLLPAGVTARRHFSFEKGEKFLRHRMFRWFTDALLTRRCHVADYFFSLPPMEPRARLEEILGLARRSSVEVETHPVHPDEYRFLTNGEIFKWIGEIPIAPRYELKTARPEGSGHT